MDFSNLTKNTMIDFLGIEPVELNKDKVVLTMPVSPKTKQPFGMLHGGASVVLAETAASIGSNLNINQDEQVAFGLEINANHIRSKRDGIVTATATPIHVGKKTMVWDIKITDENEKLICISRCTCSIITN